MTAIGQRVDFHSVLAAPARSPEIPESADLYGWLCGSWDLEVIHYRGLNVSSSGLRAEVHAGFVLEGRAVQDVWIMPPRAERTAAMDMTMNMYGTTLRSWDPAIQAWRIAWNNPARGHREEQIGRRRGADIVQDGTRADGTKTRWTFTEITPDGFHWRGEAMYPDKQTWTLEGEFLAKRRR
ncbi:MAG TPA: hypothetical protein VH497_07600 [Vicinamibacterales bacterium]|jgi:hypothetical protein